MSSISIVIPLWNGRNLIPACLESLRQQRLRDGCAPEIIVVDNASIDGSPEWIADHEPHVSLIRNRNNLGFGGGCNRGLRSAHGEVVVLLNQDTLVYPGWLQAIEKAFENPNVGIAGCKIYYPDGKTIQHAGGQIDWPGGNGTHIGYKEQDTGQWDEPRPLEWVTGAAMAIRRSVYEAIGGLDEAFWPGYFEDVDYCLRARAHGFEVWYIPTARLQHQESTSIRNPKELQRIHERNRLLCWLKHIPPEKWLQDVAPLEEATVKNSSHDDLSLRRHNCLELAILAPALLTRFWQADDHMIDAVVDAFHRIANAQDFPPPSTDVPTLQPVEFRALPELKLTEFEFHSQMPVFGSLLSAFRRFSYGISTRWVIHHLHKELGAYFQAQQNFSRQQITQIETQQYNVLQMQNYSSQQKEALQSQMKDLRDQLDILVKRNASLTNQILHLQHQIEEPQK